MNSILPVVLTLAGGIVAWLGQSALSRRAKSGRTNTSEAAELWEESRAIRVELWAEMKSLREENAVLRKRVADLESRLGGKMGG